MDVFLMIRRRKTTIFTDAKESTPVGDVKKIIDGILKVPVENQRLYKDDTNDPNKKVLLSDDHKSLGDCGFTSTVARAQAPATIGLVFRSEDGEWETLDVQALSSPPELPDVMKPQDASQTHQQETNTA